MQISTISPSTFDDGKPVTLTGSGFGASQGHVLIGGVAQNVNTWSDTSITFTTVRGSQSLGACRVDVVRGTGATLLLSANFENGFPSDPWGYGSQNSGTLTVESTGTYGNSVGSLKGSIPGTGDGIFQWLNGNLTSHNLSEVYIQFKAKMPGNKKGIKFCKVFGQNNGHYANCTFGLVYGSGSMEQVSFGDGSALDNDTAHVINFDGTYPSWIGRSYGTAVVSTPQNATWPASNWGTAWHDFKLHVKFNSGTTAENEVADGAFYVEIDGVVYVNATGLFNRHYSNPPIDRVVFFDYCSPGTTPFELWYDDIKISTGGFV